MDKKSARIKRAKRTRIQYKEQDKIRLCVIRTPKHTYAQVISGDGSKVIACASTVEKDIRSECSYGGNISASKAVGKYVAERAIKAGVDRVSFDRSGYKYHGRVKALADSAREHGLKL